MIHLFSQKNLAYSFSKMVRPRLIHPELEKKLTVGHLFEQQRPTPLVKSAFRAAPIQQSSSIGTTLLLSCTEPGPIIIFSVITSLWPYLAIEEK